MPNTPEGAETLRLEVKHFGVVSAPNNLCLGKKKKILFRSRKVVFSTSHFEIQDESVSHKDTKKMLSSKEQPLRR